MKCPSHTLAYASVNAAYWAAHNLIADFAVLFLTARAFNNTQAGGVLAAGLVLGTLMGPVMSARLDKDPRLSPLSLIGLCIGLETLALGILLLFPGGRLLTVTAYAIYLGFCIPINSLSLKLYGDARKKGLDLHYGLCRGSGSLGYVFASVLIGLIVKSSSENMLLYIGFPVLLLQFFTNFSFQRGIRRVQSPVTDNLPREAPQKAVSLPVFFRRNPRFTLLLVSTVLLFLGHMATGTYRIRLVEELGGDVSLMGLSNGINALCEVPFLLFYPRIRGKRSAAQMLRFASALLFVKYLLLALAPSMLVHYLVCLLQGPSFGIYTGAIVEYVQDSVAPEDQAKGQSLAFSTTMLASVLSSIIVGAFLDRFSVRTSFLLIDALSFPGLLVYQILLWKKPKKL